jgi:4-amino-4-deoxy-L-arabinose transferase-like glycosyltransferase
VFTFLFVGAAYAAIRSLEDGRVLRGPLTTRHAWLLAAGALLGLSATVRAVGGLLVPFLALWAALAIRQRWPLRIATGAIAIAPAVAILLTYFAFNQAHTGTFGLTQAGGWSLYSRVAQFADCTQFTPPEGTEELCETTPPEERPGPDYYTWQEGSPARDLFGPPPAGNELLSEFGREALLAQPIDYARAALTDLGRYFVPSLGLPRPYSGTDYTYLNIDRRETVPIEEEIVRWIGGYFDPISPHISGLALTLSDMQQVMRVHPILLLQAVLLGIAGFVFARGRVRAAIALLTGAGFLLIALAAATGTVHPRYTIPAGGPLAAGAALSLWVLLGRYVERARAAP